MFFNRKLRDTLFASVSAGTLAAASSALGNPLDPTVVAGDVTISGTGTDHVIIQNDSMRSVVDWDSFSIGSGETTSINQIANDAAILNRVTGGDISKIYGTLESNGQVFLINENGILIGAGGLVDTGGFVASTLNVSNADFLGAGDMLFSQGIETGGGITVHGTIRSVTGGDIFLLSREIEIGETGRIESNGGYVGLGAGEEILLRPVDSGDGRISIRAGKGKIVNRGHIEGAAAELRAAGGNEYALAINNSGVVRANGVSKKGGRILLTGGGKVRNSGQMVARKKVVVRSTKQIVNSGAVKAGAETGGEIIFEAPEITVEAGSLLDVSGALGGGRMFVGGGFQGSGTDHEGNAVDIAENARIVTVETGAVLNASATQSGDAGEIIVWSDNSTTFSGDIVAEAVDGAGGFAEVSGKKTLAFRPSNVDLSGTTAAGELWLDPEDLNVVAGATTGVLPNEISDADIQTILEGGTSVTLTTTPSASGGVVIDGTTTGGPGDVNFAAGVRIIWTDNNSGSDQDALFTVHADRDINALDDVLIQHSEVGDGTTTFVDGEGGVVFLAGRDINIGSATMRTGGVAIGSEFGSNLFVAGDSDFNNFADSGGTYAGDGDINVTGGDAAAAFAQLGYIIKQARANGSGNDFSDGSGNHAFNGSLLVRAGGSVSLTGGDEALSFAQIGHGGYNTVSQTEIAEISGIVAVLAGSIVSGSVDLEHAAKESDATGASYGSHAQIGHGGVLVSTGDGTDALVHGDISGNVSVFRGNENVDVDINLNTAFAASSDGSDDENLSQIGSGGHLFYTGSGISGVEATHGDIQGAVLIDITGAVNLGGSASAAASDDRYAIQSLIGHGGHIRMAYDGTDVTGDGSLDADHGSIMTFRAVTTAQHSTDITISAAEYNIIAQEATQNSAGSTGLIYDNLQRSQIGHGSETNVERATALSGGGQYTGPANIPNDSGLYGDAAGEAVATLADVDLSGLTEAQRDNLIAFIESNTDTILAGMPLGTQSLDGSLDVSVTEHRIAGDISIIDDTADDTGGVTLSSTISVGLTKTDHDVMIARIGHASLHNINSADGGKTNEASDLLEAFNGGNITVFQAHILDADITVDTLTVDGIAGNGDDFTEGDNQDVTLETSISAGLAQATDNTAVAQIGHGADTFASSGKGGDATGESPDTPSADGGDIAIVRGTVWDGSLTRDTDADSDDDLQVVNTTDIQILSSNEIIVDSDTAAALASTLRSNSESQIGHGFRIRLDTGDGGSSSGAGTSGGAGGDVMIYQGVDHREYGIDNDMYDDFAYGLRGDISLLATELDGAEGTYAISLTSNDSSALAKTDFNSDYSTVGHGDVIEITTGNGGDGSSGLDFEGDDDIALGANSDDDLLGQQESHGGRGGHIDVALGRTLSVDQSLIVDIYGSSHPNNAVIGDYRDGTSLISNSTTPARGGVSLIEGDIVITAYGAILEQAQVNNALSPADHAISESIIGHSMRAFADSGDGGDGGSGNFHAQSETVFDSEEDGEQFLNYESGQGSNRGGNGGDIRLTFGDITDRNIWDADGSGHAEIHHDTDADNLGHLNGQGMPSGGIFDVSSDISIRIFDTDGTTDAHLADSLIITSQVNAGLGEGDGADIQSGVGHHVRLFAEGGAGGDGGSSNTEFDVDGNSLFDSGLGQTDTQGSPDSEDGVDETALQAGAVYIQPNSSGGRGGDAFVVNNNIAGDIVIEADRRVTVQVPNGHGGYSKVFASLGHTTHLVAVTQAGGDAGNLYEMNDTGATYDGGIINVDGSELPATQTGENGDAGSSLPGFDHRLIDANQDDEFNLDNIGGEAGETDGEDGIAVTPTDIATRQGSTFQSINDELGTLTADTVTDYGGGAGLNADNVQVYVAADSNDVIFHDEEADPNFILDNNDNFVLNTEANNELYAENAGNLARFGRVVATYDAYDDDTNNELSGSTGGQNLFDATMGPSGDPSRTRALQVFVDMDLDGDVDLVDFDRDGRLDIVDVDHDGRMDVIDGRANYVDVDDVPINGFYSNGISGLGVLDYVAVTGRGYSDSAAQANGTNWSTERELTTLDLLADYNNEGTVTDFTALVSDFATANGGRGGDAYTQAGYSVGDISVSTGDNDMGEADSLVVLTNIADGVPSKPNDLLRANIGHAAFQWSDTDASYARYRAGREGLDEETDLHGPADGGDAARYAVNGNGGRGGNALVRQGADRDVDPDHDAVNIEYDHLVGHIWVNTPNALHNIPSSDAGRVSFTANTGSIDAGSNTLVTVLGHNSMAAATAGNSGGRGESHQGPGEGPNGSSQTEIANGGDGGEGHVLQRQIKGTITLMTAGDELDGSNDVSVILTASNIDISGGDNTVIAQFGHGRIAAAAGGDGGTGDDGQLSGNGGAGGDASITQEAILDTGITVDLVEQADLSLLFGYDGNGMLISATSHSGSNDIIRAQVGHGDLAVAVGGAGGNGTEEWVVNEQRNQTANGGDGGNATINQAGYNYDITLDIGSNETGGNALEIISDAGAITNGANDHILATVGHGGYGLAISGNGGNGGLSGAVNGIQSDVDPNLVDSDYDYSDNVTDNGDTPYAIDVANGFVLGTDRNGGHAGDAVVNIGVDGTGRDIDGRDSNNDYGINDTDGASISVVTHDWWDSDTGSFRIGGYDGILVQTILGPGTNLDSALEVNSALVGHHGFAETVGGAGGLGIQSGLSAQISEGDGGDGGSAITTSGAIRGDVSVTNVALLPGVLNRNNDPANMADTDIVVETINGTPSDATEHRGEARIGHLTQLEATGGDGGDSAREAGDVPSFPATISTQGGDGGDALTFQGQLAGDILVEAENSVIFSARDTTVASGALIAAAGHRTVGEAFAGNGAFGGTYNGDSQEQSVYFTYEALREFHARRTAGASDEDAFNALSEFEQKLVAPVVDYFENKEGELEIFLDKLIGDEAVLIANNERDDDFIGGANFTIPALVDGQGHIDGADDGEIETLSAILAASGHGGNAIVVQGSTGLDGVGDELSANGDISLIAHGFDTTDADRGIIVESVAGATGGSFELAHIGHQAEAHQVVAGFGQEVNGKNAGANGIGGDGGDAVVDQYAQNGSIDLVSSHEILVSARDVGDADHEVRTWIGHRLTVGSDYTQYRNKFSAVGGKGGDEQSVPYADGHNGNGGDVFIYQRGVISGTARDKSDEEYDTEISLAALQDSDDHESIRIEALEAGVGNDDVETHVGHDFLIHAVKAGDAGRQAVLSGPNGAAEGLLEGNGGDIFIAQTDLGADIDIVGRDDVAIEVNTVLGAHAHLMIGHERTIGNSAELADTLDGGVADNPRQGYIIAGFGGDAYPEDVNGTAMASRVAAAAGIIEDGDSGRIEIALGQITDSDEGDDDDRLITITSITEDVTIEAISATGSVSVLEIGNQQQVTAETLSAGELQSVPFIQTAGDAGGIYINRATISGDILIQAIDADRASSEDPTMGKQVVIDSVSGAGATSVTQIGHETQFTAIAGTPVTARAAFGEDRNFLFETNLTDFASLEPAGSNLDGEATLRDAQNAVEDMENVVRALELALENADRFPEDDGVSEIASDQSVDQGELFSLLADARAALASARADLANIGSGVGNISEATAVNNVRSYAMDVIAAAGDFDLVLDSIPQAFEQIADFAEGGDIVYGQLTGLALDGNNGLNSHTSSITGVAGLGITANLTIDPAPLPGALVAEGFNVADTGLVEGNVDILSGRDDDLTGITLTSVDDVIGNDTIVATNFGGTGFTAEDDLHDSVVQISATADARALTEIGHRRIMNNTTEYGGGDTNASPEEGGVAGDGGSIVTRNFTAGDITVQAEEVVIYANGAAGESEVHLLHSSHTTNIAGWSDIQSLLGNGGDIINTTSVSGGVSINAEQVASAFNAMDRKILAAGLADSFIHLGHQAEDKNDSESDPVEAGNQGDTQANLGSNRGGFIVSTQTVRGNDDGDLVVITLDAAGDGNPTDFILETGGLNDSDIRLGNGEDGGHRGILNEGLSGVNQLDDGSTVDLMQFVYGDIEINTVEDFWINVGGTGDQAIYLGHDAEQFGQSGEVNSPPTILQHGERVTVYQEVFGDVNIATTSSFTADLATTANELHIGHEATQSAFSADDGPNPSDLEDVDGDGIADNGTGGAEGPSATGVNDNFDQPDVMATQLVHAGISVITGEITLTSGSADRLHVGHEAYHLAAADGDQSDELGDNPAVEGTSVLNGTTAHVVASSIINGDGSDIVFHADGATGQVDTAAAGEGGFDAVNGTQGDIQLIASAAGEIQVGHRSVSTMGDVTPSSAPEAQFDALQAIGSSTLNAEGTEVADTTESVIEFRAVQDIILASATGETQVGHYITEEGNPASTTSPVFVDDDAATGLAEGDSELRQIVGSDIIFGDNTSQGSGGTGAEGAGNNVILETATGRTMIGHQSPASNEWQVEDGTRSVTVQLLDGDITVEAGTDAGADAPDGGTIGSAAGAVADESGLGDDILILSGGGTARIGHNMAGGDEGVNNETQRSAGDVWVRAGGDLHVLGGAIGHENYDFASVTPSTLNATPESLASASPIRDRIRGITTVGAGQNSAPEDSTLIGDVMVFDGGSNPVTVNSGYGGQGMADVNGQLRFFLPAQEGLTIVSPVTFNDSASNADPVLDRDADPSNVFEGQGGFDHEHDFTFMSEAAPYTDAFIGLGNFTFYFESPPPSGYFPEYTPYINLIDLDPGFAVIFDREGGPDGQGTVNMGELAGENYLGTSSFDVDCEEDQLGQLDDLGGWTEEERRSLSEQCERIRTHHMGSPAGFGSHWGFSATAGGNQTFGHGLPDDLENAATNGSFGYAIPVSPQAHQPVMIDPLRFTANQNDYGVMTAYQPVGAGPLMTSAYAPVIAGSMNETEISYAPGDSYGEYITGEGINRGMQQASYPEAMSYASSYTVFVQRPL